MKKFFGTLAILAAAFFFTGCSEDVEDALTVSSSKIVASATGQQQTISFETNVDWTVSSSADWVTVNPASGAAGMGSVTVSINANDTYNTRSATITLHAGTKTSTWTIDQDFVQVFGAASQINVTAAAQTIEVAYTANQAVEAKSDVDWIKVVSTKAAPSTKTVTLSISENTVFEPRSGKITLTAADGSVSSFAVIQAGAGEGAMILKSVTYLGTSMMPYDDDNWCPKSFEEYALAFETKDGEVIIAVNAQKGDLNGEYLVDAGADHQTGTFSIKPADRNEKYYTAIFEKGQEITVTDGMVTIAQADGKLSVSAQFLDDKEKEYTFAYNGADMEAAIDNLRAVGTASYGGDYYTHFASGQKSYSITLHPSASAKEGDPFFFSVGFDIQADKSYDGTTLPTGLFTITSEEGTIESDYANGVYFYPENSSKASYMYADYNFETDEYKNYEQTGGTVEITDGSAEGLYTFDINVTAKPYWYDDDWNTVYGDEITWSCKFENVAIAIKDNHQEPEEDGDAVFTGASISANYNGFWYGDLYENGANVFCLGWSYVNGNYTVQIVCQTDQPYTYEKNFSNRYCNTPLPDGTYTWSADSPNDAEGKPLNCICNVTSTSYRTVTNGYTGTKSYITGGSVTFDNGNVTFDLTTTTDAGEELHFTGGFASTAYYFQDYSANATRRAQAAWLVAEEPEPAE